MTGLCCITFFHVGVASSDEDFTSRGTVELGLGAVNLDHQNSKYGEYSGIDDDNVYLIGNSRIHAEDDRDYFEFNAKDLDLDSRQASIEAGKAGAYFLKISHDEIPHLIASNARTPFSGAGSERLTLPDGFVRAATTSGMTNLDESLKTLDLRTDRKENLAQFGGTLQDGWRMNLSIRREDKNGIQSLGAVTAQSGGQADSVILPQPVDYRTEELAATLAFDGAQRQFEIGYFLSLFHDENSSITWDVPFLKAAPTAFDYPTTARISLPPDNRYQRLNVSGGIDLPASSRLSAVIEIGEMTQDDSFLPYSTDDIGGTAAPMQDGDALPRSSARAGIDVAHLLLNFASRPVPRLGITAHYRFYDTDNKTPYTLFDRVIDDTVPQSATVDIYSRPYDFTQSEFGIGGSYRFKNEMNLTSDYKHEVTDYGKYRSVETVAEDTLKLVLRKRVTDELNGRLEYVYAQRDAGNYDYFRSYGSLLASLSCPSIVIVNPDPDTGGSTAVDTCFNNHPDLRQFNIASREQNRLSAAMDYNPGEAVDISLDISSSRTDYHDDITFDDTYLGLTDDDDLNATIDISYAPADEPWSVSAYYTNERIGSSQTGRAYNAAVSSAIDSSLNWSADFDDDTDTIGLRSELNLLYDSLTLAVNYVYTRGTGRIEFTSGTGLTHEDMPEDKNIRQLVEINAIYRMSDHIRLGFGAGYETFKSRDWSLDSIEAGGIELDDILLLTGPREDYRAYLLSATLLYSW